MLIEFRAADRVLGLKALGIYAKGIEAATAACGKVYVSTMALQEADTDADKARLWIVEQDEMEPGETRELDIPSRLALTLRTAASVYMTSLSKLAEKEGDLLVSVENTQDLMSQLQSLADRCKGQIEFSGIVDAMNEAARDAGPDENDDMTTTVRIGNGPEMPFAQLERGVKAMSKRVR